MSVYLGKRVVMQFGCKSLAHQVNKIISVETLSVILRDLLEFRLESFDGVSTTLNMGKVRRK
jgi:hypothetical protein